MNRLALFLGSILACQTLGATATNEAARRIPSPASAVLLSDIHFDAFLDPAKARRLIAAPVDRWDAILAAPDSPDRAAARDALMRHCPSHDVDSSYALLQSALRKAHDVQADARFVVFAGDLLAHGFQCRYEALMPDAKPTDYATFVTKTAKFLIGKMRQAFPQRPLLVALGNHDSGCGNYRQDVADAWQAGMAADIAGAATASPAERADIARQFASSGHYVARIESLGLTLIVIDDTRLSRNFHNCAGEASVRQADEELAWLEKALRSARSANARVWILGHIPPGIEPWASLRSGAACRKESPVPFLASDGLERLLLQHADVVRVGIFGHTHMDEFRLLHDESLPSSDPARDIPIKVLPAITPSGGNLPAFTVATIDPRGGMADYAVYSASNSSGLEARWNRLYTFREAYGQTSFSAGAVRSLVQTFSSDPAGADAMSRSYQRNYSSGTNRPATSLLSNADVWPAYVCAMTHASTKGFRDCSCAEP